jgi:hypothetical protein
LPQLVGACAERRAGPPVERRAAAIGCEHTNPPAGHDAPAAMYPRAALSNRGEGRTKRVAEIDRTAKHMRASPDWKVPTEAQKADGRRAFEEAIERIRAERQAVRDFSDKIERERAERAA